MSPMHGHALLVSYFCATQKQSRCFLLSKSHSVKLHQNTEQKEESKKRSAPRVAFVCAQVECSVAVDFDRVRHRSANNATPLHADPHHADIRCRHTWARDKQKLGIRPQRKCMEDTRM